MWSSNVVSSISDRSMSNNRSSIVNSWCDHSSLIDGSVSWVLGFNSGFVGLDVGSEASGIGHIVDYSLSTISD